MRITKVYTRAGDTGETSLVGGQRISKASLRVEAYGDIDELNSVIGVARAQLQESEIDQVLRSLQNELFTVGADLASPDGIPVPRVGNEWVVRLEQLIDRYNEQLRPLEEFILPSGDRAATLLHLARTVARRAERHIVQLSREKQVHGELLAYVNRLSDLLFVLARVTNVRSGTSEEAARFSHRER